MIYINAAVLHTLVPHTKFQGNWLSGSGEDFKVFSIFEHGGHLGLVAWTIYINFRSPFSRMLHIKFGIDWPLVFDKKIFESGGRHGRTDERRLKGYTISSPREPKGSGEQKF